MTSEIKICTDAFSTLLKEASARNIAPENPPESSPGNIASSSSAQANEQRASRATGAPGIVRKTALELQSFRDKLSQLVQESTDREKERQKLLPPPPPAEPPHQIEDFKYASLCPSKFEAMSGTERCHFCNKCGLSVYNFSKMDATDAGKLIFQREGILKPTFYKRTDGKFLTRDCPVGVRRRQTRIAAMAAMLLLATGAATAGLFLILTLHPIPEQAVSQPEDSTAAFKTTETGSASDLGEAAPSSQTGFALPRPDLVPTQSSPLEQAEGPPLAEALLAEMGPDNAMADEPESDSEQAQTPPVSGTQPASSSGNEAPPDLR